MLVVVKQHCHCCFSGTGGATVALSLPLTQWWWWCSVIVIIILVAWMPPCCCHPGSGKMASLLLFQWHGWCYCAIIVDTVVVVTWCCWHSGGGGDASSLSLLLLFWWHRWCHHAVIVVDAMVVVVMHHCHHLVAWMVAPCCAIVIVIIISVAWVMPPCHCHCHWSDSGGGGDMASSSSLFWWHRWCHHCHCQHYLVVVEAWPRACWCRLSHYLSCLTVVVAQPRACHGHCLIAAVAQPGACHCHCHGLLYHVAAQALHHCCWAAMVAYRPGHIVIIITSHYRQGGGPRAAWGMLPSCNGGITHCCPSHHCLSCIAPFLSHGAVKAQECGGMVAALTWHCCCCCCPYHGMVVRRNDCKEGMLHFQPWSHDPLSTCTNDTKKSLSPHN